MDYTKSRINLMSGNYTNMKQLIFLASLIISTISQSIAQKDGDVFKTNNGDITIYPILHGTLAIQWQDKTIYFDPYGGAEVFTGLPDPDLVLITDIHGDHHNQETLDALNLVNSTLVVPQAVKDKFPENYSDKVNAIVTIGNGADIKVSGINIEALPMYNMPPDEDSRHTKGRGNGYVLTIADKRIYISGDTEDIPEMRSLKNIDIAFVCMNMPYTMDVEQASSAVLEFQPKVVYPYHYRGGGGKFSNVEKFKELVNKGKGSIEVRLKNWYPN